MAPARILAAAFVALVMPLHAAVLYKSLSPRGVIEFSDTPPENNTILERIPVHREGEPQPDASAPLPAEPPPVESAKSRAADAMIDKANAQLDLAEHALALARQGRGSEADPMRLAAPRMTPADLARVDFYRKNVAAARRQLMQALSMKRRAEPDVYTALNTSPLLR